MFLNFQFLIFMAPFLLLSMAASFMVQSAFKKYSRVRSVRGLTGAEAAAELLRRGGITDVRIEVTGGFLSDHYNPITKTLGLSQDVYHSDSIAAIGVATHEAGHALQHARHYAPLWVRSALVPTAGIGSNLGYMVMALGWFLFHSQTLVLVGAVLFSAVLVFQIVTLPVEFDASARAKRLAVEYGILLPSEQSGMNRVLNAAALTYVAAVVATLMTLIFFLLRAGLIGGRDD